MSLATYRKKRDFAKSPEPQGSKEANRKGARQFVIQKHAASRLHFDFRLELDGVLKSWAVPKGPSLDPHERSLAVEVEDHPLEYATFEGVIPAGEYGGGSVMVWDRGTWTAEGNPQRALKKGKLSFRLDGERLQGAWTLVRMRAKSPDDERSNWLLIKKDDEDAKPNEQYALVDNQVASVLTGREMHEIAADRDRTWQSGKDKGAELLDGQQVRPPSGELPEVERIPGARQRTLPRHFKPQLATLATNVPQGDAWIHELKFDGYRILAQCRGGDARLLTRRGEDWTDRFPSIVAGLRELALVETMLDGEAVVIDKHGASDFQALQNMLRNRRDEDVRYFVFDAPYLEGYDLTAAKLIDRKKAVRRVLQVDARGGTIRYSDHIRGDGGDVVEHACRHALEGVVSKRIDAPYQQRRSADWLKIKCLHRQEFVIGGWTEPSGSRVGFGALLLGHYHEDALVYSGRVGAGFTKDSLQEIHEKLRGIPADKPPFDDPPVGAAARDVRWVQPQLVAEVEFTQWTDDGMLRHPSFKGLREDKAPESITREIAQRPSPRKSTASNRHTSMNRNGDSLVAGVKITHPDRVVYPEQGVTKRELAEYYAAAAEHMLPYVANRPLTVVRCPQGRQQHCFYQKHAAESVPQAVGRVDVEEQGGTAQYLTIRDAAGLVSLIQIGVLELHPWGSRNDRLDRPDVLVFDLDPGEAAQWRQVVDGADELRRRLDAVGLISFLRTTGGKGLHVVVPLTRRQGWDKAKRFARSVAEAMARDAPRDFVATASKAKRRGKVYVDYLRNAQGATAIANYSARARPGAPIATPLSWDELSLKLRPDQFHSGNVRQRLASLAGDPWEGFFEVRQSLTKSAMKVAGEP